MPPSRKFPAIRDSSAEPFAAPADAGTAEFGAAHESRSAACSTLEEIAAQAISDLAGIDAVVLLLGCGDRTQHEGMSDLRGRCMWL